jgi:manganese/zinc/iron transport system substrate-binding protein
MKLYLPYSPFGRLHVQFLCLFLMHSLAGCREQHATSDKIQILTTTGIIKDIVKNITGDLAEVNALMGPGVDPHLYKATYGDLQRLTSANIIFFNGLHLEGKMGEVLTKLSRLQPVVALADGLPGERLRKTDGFQGSYDPHIWFDVELFRKTLTTITAALQKIDSAHADEYRHNSKRYAQRLDSLHILVKEKIQSIPAEQRVLITAHDAFGYFGDAYGIEVIGLQGISTLAEFGLRDVTDLVDEIVRRKIKAIFLETSVSERSINAVVEGCRRKGWNVQVGGSLYSDALGEADSPAGTYEGMVLTNVNIIVKALK